MLSHSSGTHIISYLNNPEYPMAEKTQDYKTHRMYVPTFHFFVLPVLLINVGIEAARLYRYQTPYHVWLVIFAMSLVVFAFAARGMAARAQDRVIRLEERQRLSSLMPADQRAQIDGLTPRQLVSLRFASDEEAPALVQRTLAGEFKSGEEIKKAIKNWRPDYYRV